MKYGVRTKRMSTCNTHTTYTAIGYLGSPNNARLANSEKVSATLV